MAARLSRAASLVFSNSPSFDSAADLASRSFAIAAAISSCSVLSRLTASSADAAAFSIAAAFSTAACRSAASFSRRPSASRCIAFRRWRSSTSCFCFASSVSTRSLRACSCSTNDGLTTSGSAPPARRLAPRPAGPPSYAS